MNSRESYRMQVIFPERRQKKRYVTMRNAGIAGIALVVAFLALSAWSAFRPHSGVSGGLLQSPAGASDPTSIGHDPIVVSEGSIYDHPGTKDSILLDPQTQDQLRAPSAPPAAPAPATVHTEPAPTPKP
jgi:hypothetical protein